LERREPEYESHDGGDTRDVDDDAGVVQQGYQAHTVVIDEAVAQQRKCEHQKNVGGGRSDAEKRKNELRATEIDSCEGRDQADDIQPCDEPGGCRAA